MKTLTSKVQKFFLFWANYLFLNWCIQFDKQAHNKTELIVLEQNSECSDGVLISIEKFKLK